MKGRGRLLAICMPLAAMGACDAFDGAVDSPDGVPDGAAPDRMEMDGAPPPVRDTGAPTDAGLEGDAASRRLLAFVSAVRADGTMRFDSEGGLTTGLAYARAKEACRKDGVAALGPGVAFEPGICTPPNEGAPPQTDLAARLPPGQWFLRGEADAAAIKDTGGFRLLGRIQLRPDGTPVDKNERVWTACTGNANWPASGDRDCTGWTDGSDASVGVTGDAIWATTPGTGFSISSAPCSDRRPIYCFQVP